MGKNMNIVFWGKGKRGFYCLEKILEHGESVSTVVGHKGEKINEYSIQYLAEKNSIKFVSPSDPNSIEFLKFLKDKKPDLFILGGYGKILSNEIINIPSIFTINFHGGKLPQYRGSSPMNWSLINGESSFTLSIIKVDKGIDTGPIISESTFKININDTIVHLHSIANKVFPEMLLDVIEQIKNGRYNLKEQEHKEGSYYPLRFPEDGFVLFDQLSAEQIHNRIKALTEPYPCAFSYYKKKKVKFISSEFCKNPYYGEPGRIYKISKKGLLVCAKDQCLWITEALFSETGLPLVDIVKRYDKLATIRGSILNSFGNTIH